MSEGVRPEPQRPALAVESVSVSYGANPPVVADVSLQVAEGQWLALLGPNGAGKSSLLKAMAGLVSYTGRISPDPAPRERQRQRQPRPEAATTAYVPQTPMLPAGMTVAEYTLLGRSAHLGWLEAEGRNDRAIVDDVLDRLSLRDFADRDVTELSGGEVQRVTLARALAQRAGILLLDEPTSALDIGQRIAVLELIDELRREEGLTVVTVMHDLGTAGRFADSLALLHQGELVSVGAPEDVLTDETLSYYYQTPVRVVVGPDGVRLVVPLRHREHGDVPPKKEASSSS